VPFNVAQMRELGVLCLRLESLATGRTFRTVLTAGLAPVRRTMGTSSAVFRGQLYGDPNVLLPPMNDQSTDLDLMWLLDSLATRIENAACALGTPMYHKRGACVSFDGAFGA